MASLEDEYYVLEIDRDTAHCITENRIPDNRIDLNNTPVIEYFINPNEGGRAITGPLMMGGPRYLIQKPIYKAIGKYEHDGVQFLPVILHKKEKKLNHYLVNFYKEMPWIDLEKSVYEDLDLTLHGVEKLVLNREVVESVPKENRMIFSPEECPDLFICHRDVVESIFAFYRDFYDDNPDGIKFTKLSEFTKE